jgi:hypothetical protein
MRQRRDLSPAILLLLIVLAATDVVLAENMDPGNDDSQYAWAENVGWINTEPSGDGGPGVQVDEFALSGWMWGENIGWISLSCENTASCHVSDYGVTNDGVGTLRGYAWAENTGWISFSCANTASCGTADYGVTIDPFTGDFGGDAWGENIGWATFASSGPYPYKVQTSWRCTDDDTDGVCTVIDNCPDVPNPGQEDTDTDHDGDICDNCPSTPNATQGDYDSDGEGDFCDLDDGLISLFFSSGVDLGWDAESGYDSWNVYRGDLEVLKDTGTYTQEPGSNDLAGMYCGLAAPSISDPGVPMAGATAYYLTTGVSGGVEGSLGTDSSGVERPNHNPCP